MKKKNYYLLFIFFLTVNLIHAQEVIQSQFNIIAYGKIGFGLVENDNEPNYNLNSSSAEVLLNYRINREFGIATGIGINELSGNGFNSIGNFYHERTMLKIPLSATMDFSTSEKVKLVANFGFYGQYITKDEHRFLTNSQKGIYDGWNFGAQIGLGLVFKLFDNFSAGINYTGQSDFSKFKTNSNQVIYDEQKLNNLNSMGIILMIEL